MKLPDLCIQRPVFATVINLVVLLVGLIAYNQLTVREYPKIDEPVVTVQTNYRGASAEIIESRVTQPLEDSLSGIEGINFMTSISRTEQSQITITFRLNRDVDVAANDVRDRVARVRAQLPDDIDEPVISKVEADAQPIIYLAFSSDRFSPMEVTDFADRIVRDRLAERGRRRGRPYLRRAALLDAHLAGPGAHGRLRPVARRTWKRRCANRTSKSRPGASKARCANSRSSTRPTCAPPTSSRTSYCAT